MTDDLPPHGVRRPNPGDLLELDDVAVMCRQAVAAVRGQVAAARDRVAMWTLPVPPARRPDPASSPGRGDRRPI
jgi:hypothetical protein